jgi:hypothetical protein
MKQGGAVAAADVARLGYAAPAKARRAIEAPALDKAAE